MLHLPDWSKIDLPEHERRIQSIIGVNAALYLPLLHQGECIGLLALASKQANVFSANDIELAKSFRDQALIAIQNTRMFNETREALERQTATADILKVIASSPSDVQPVFEAIAERANRLIGGLSTAVLRVVGDQIHLAAFTSMGEVADRALQALYPRPVAEVTGVDRLREGRTVQITGYRNCVRCPWEYPGSRAASRLPQHPVHSADSRPRAARDHRRHAPGARRVRPRLATAQDLRRPGRDRHPERAAVQRDPGGAGAADRHRRHPEGHRQFAVGRAAGVRGYRRAIEALVDALSTTVFRLVDGVMHLKAFTPTSPQADAALKALFPAPLSNFSWGEAVRGGEIHRVVDTENEIDELARPARLRGFRSMLFVPLMRDGARSALIAVTRVEPGPFADHHVAVLQTFADQAVIAIENARLFDEVQAKYARPRGIAAQQTATADVLKVISRSAFDLDAVFDTLDRLGGVDFATRQTGVIFLRDGDRFVAPRSATSARVRRDILRQIRRARSTRPRHGRALLTRRGRPHPGRSARSRLQFARAAASLALSRSCSACR